MKYVTGFALHFTIVSENFKLFHDFRRLRESERFSFNIYLNKFLRENSTLDPKKIYIHYVKNEFHFLLIIFEGS